MRFTCPHTEERLSWRDVPTCSPLTESRLTTTRRRSRQEPRTYDWAGPGASRIRGDLLPGRGRDKVGRPVAFWKGSVTPSRPRSLVVFRQERSGAECLGHPSTQWRLVRSLPEGRLQAA